jgi:hypothetical protein
MSNPPVAVVGYYHDELGFTTAVAAAVTAGKHPQAFSPYPVHGLNEVLGIKRSLIGRPVFAAIIAGFVVMLTLSWYMMSQSWPLNVGGKPYYDWRCFFVISLEIGLLLGTLTNFLLAAHYCRLAPSHDTRLPNPRMSDDTFALVLPCASLEQSGELSAWLTSHLALEIQALPRHTESALIESSSAESTKGAAHG